MTFTLRTTVENRAELAHVLHRLARLFQLGGSEMIDGPVFDRMSFRFCPGCGSPCPLPALEVEA